MGLDMYCYAVPENLVEGKGDTDVVFCAEAKEKKEEIFYWRKHHDLHGWMENLYRDKGGAAESFNCVNLRITEEDLDALKADITKKNLPNTTGFFFGDNPPDDETQIEDLGFIVLARETIKKGMAVFYDSWW
jgi:hypothetical protein